MTNCQVKHGLQRNTTDAVLCSSRAAGPGARHTLGSGGGGVTQAAPSAVRGFGKGPTVEREDFALCPAHGEGFYRGNEGKAFLAGEMGL